MYQQGWDFTKQDDSWIFIFLGFEVSVDHPNTFVVKCAQLVKGIYNFIFSSFYKFLCFDSVKIINLLVYSLI